MYWVQRWTQSGSLIMLTEGTVLFSWQTQSPSGQIQTQDRDQVLDTEQVQTGSISRQSVWEQVLGCDIFYFFVCQSWGSDEDHGGGEAVERNAHPPEPDRRTAGFWSEWHSLIGNKVTLNGYWTFWGINTIRKKLRRSIKTTCKLQHLLWRLFKAKLKNV